MSTLRLTGILAVIGTFAAAGLSADPPRRAESSAPPAKAEKPPASRKPDLSKQFLPPAGAGKKWRLFWNDEFDAKKIDESQWEIMGDWKRRDGYWVKADSYLDGNGCLLLRTKRDGDRFTSGAMRTRGKFEHRFGYWECRCKFPTQEGHWPAFWLFSTSVGKVGNEGRDGTEIDIVETPWRKDQVQHALHWDGYGKHHRSAGKKAQVKGVSKGFHTFGLHWQPEEYVFYVDGQETWRTRAGGVSQVKAYVKLTEEIGKWGGDIRKAKLPDYFTVDYVRVWDAVDRVGPSAALFGSDANASHIVYMIDRSGSMVASFDRVRVELLKSITGLTNKQNFHIILFAKNECIEGPGKGLVAATAENKLAATRFLRQVRASGQTTVLPALKRAFAILADARARRGGRVVYLLSDGLFGGVIGGNTYVTPDGRTLLGNEAVAQYARDHNSQGENRVRVNTLLYGSREPSAVQVMKKLADESGGSFKQISADE